MGLSKRDLSRKRKSLEVELEKLQEKARKSPLNRELQEQVKDLKKKIENT